MKPVRREFVEELIDFAPTAETRSMGFAEQQLEGTVALFNMLARNRVAYLADEVGMGKTYVALGVMSLLRAQDPQARIVVIAPRENIQHKWIKELHNFVTTNWRHTGNRVKSLQGGPSWEPVACRSLAEFAHEALLNQDRDFFLRMTSFSIATKNPESRRRLRRQLRGAAPWADSAELRAFRPDTFRDAYGRALNALVPDADLVIVDEAHNLKHGFGPRVATRNRVMGLAFGHPAGRADAGDGYRQRTRRILLLSATPCEDDYGAIRGQLDVFGFGDVRLVDDRGRNALSLSQLKDPDATAAAKREVVGRLMVRRVSGLRIAGRRFTRNLYRREWRSGGLFEHDRPIRLQDARERLVVALIQQKVAEVLRRGSFTRSFQIGMLSSFESFLQSMARRRRLRAEEAEQDGDDAGLDGIFDGHDQTQDLRERAGIDTDAVTDVVRSYRDRFGTALPHPKLDAVVRALERSFETGDKTLVFVRRVATVAELASRLDRHADAWLHARMRSALPPGMHAVLDGIWQDYECARRSAELEDVPPTTAHDRQPQPDTADTDRSFRLAEDEGGTETFFSWFFRGDGPPGVLSGAAFQRNRLSGQNSPYSLLFEDDHASSLLGRPPEPLAALAAAVGRDRAAVQTELRRGAWRYFRHRTTRAAGYPRWVVFHGYQQAALGLLAACGGEVGAQARVMLQERYPESAGPEEPAPEGFPGPSAGLGVTTVCTELARRPALREALWPDDGSGDFRARFRRREQRRELFSAMARLGVSYVDLYLLAIAAVASFEPRREQTGTPHAELARSFVDLLDEQRSCATSGLCAYGELRAAAANFDLLLNVNFPTARAAPLHELARLHAATLQRQVPVGRMSGKVNHRLLRQFRMPGFPLVMVTTDVLQEGEDLHTFCRRVMHYGITWTPSAMEQRTGRVDRIGSLVQRRLDGRQEEPADDELLQVFYPHLEDTVEVLQVRHVLRRLNRFLELMHDDLADRPELESTIDTTRAMLEQDEHVPAITTELRSAFPVQRGWLDGELGPEHVPVTDHDALRAHFRTLVEELGQRCALDATDVTSDRVCRAIALLEGGRLLPAGAGAGPDTEHDEVVIDLRSQAAGAATLLRCQVAARRIDLDDDAAVDRLLELDQTLGYPRICVEPDERSKAHVVKVAGDVRFGPHTTQIEELEALVRRTVEAAAAIRAAFADEPVPHRGRRGSRRR